MSGLVSSKTTERLDRMMSVVNAGDYDTLVSEALACRMDTPVDIPSSSLPFIEKDIYRLDYTGAVIKACRIIFNLPPTHFGGETFRSVYNGLEGAFGKVSSFPPLAETAPIIPPKFELSEKDFATALTIVSVSATVIEGNYSEIESTLKFGLSDLLDIPIYFGQLANRMQGVFWELIKHGGLSFRFQKSFYDMVKRYTPPLIEKSVTYVRIPFFRRRLIKGCGLLGAFFIASNLGFDNTPHSELCTADSVERLLAELQDMFYTHSRGRGREFIDMVRMMKQQEQGAPPDAIVAGLFGNKK